MRKKLKSLAAEKEAIEKEMKKDCGRSNAEVHIVCFCICSNIQCNEVHSFEVM